MAVTIDEIKAELAGQQLSMSDRMLSAIMAKVAALQPCFDKHGYSDDDVFLITVYIASLMAVVTADGRIRSQSGPSGASRSFHFGSIGDRWRSLVNLLKGVDPHGCTDALIPKNPDQKYRCALFVSPGAPE